MKNFTLKPLKTILTQKRRERKKPTTFAYVWINEFRVTNRTI